MTIKYALLLGSSELNPIIANYYTYDQGIPQTYHMSQNTATWCLRELRTVLVKVQLWCQLGDEEEVYTLNQQLLDVI